MIESPQDMRALVAELSSAALTLSTLASLFEAGVVEQLREPRSLDELAGTCPWLGKTRLARCLALAAAYGVVAVDGDRYRLAPGAMPFAQPQLRAAMLGDLRAPLLQAVALFDSVARKQSTTGWQHTDPALLQTQGDASIGMAMAMKMNIVPQLGDLAERMARAGAKFLDVGVGVGSLAIAMCRIWPELHAVGIDGYDVPLALAKDNVARAGLAQRIELRHQTIEKLADDAAYDLAWLPTFFVDSAAIAGAVERLHASLKPGGWAVVASFGGGAGKPAAVAGMLADLWGGPVLAPGEIEALLARAGFADVKLLPGPPGGSMAVARRA